MKKTMQELQDALGTLNRERSVDKHEWGNMGPVELRKLAVKKLKSKKVEVPINASISTLIELMVEHLYQPKFDAVYAAIENLKVAEPVVAEAAEVEIVAEAAEVEIVAEAAEVEIVAEVVEPIEVANATEVEPEVEPEVDQADIETVETPVVTVEAEPVVEVADIVAALEEEVQGARNVFAMGAITSVTIADVGGDIPELPKVETPVKPKKAAKTPAEPKPKKAAAGIPDGYRARWDDDKRQYALERRGMDGVWVILGKSKRGWWVEKLTSAQPWLAKAAKDDAAAGIQVLPTNAPMPTTVESIEVVA